MCRTNAGMNRYTGFSDLCIPSSIPAKELKEILQEAVDLGYRNVAIEQIFDHTDAATPRNKKGDGIPPANKYDELSRAFHGRLKILNRLSIIFADASVTVVTGNSNNLRGYHLLAAVPTTEGAFQYACQTMICDIVSYNLDTVRLKFSRKYYYLAVAREIMFELKYAPAIADSTGRKETIARAHRYHAFGKSKNVIISSEATNRFLLRSPYDVANLGLIFGLSEEQSKSGILAMARKVLLSAEARRYGRVGMMIRRRPKKDGTVDSDDYSDSEIAEEISDDDDDDGDDDDGKEDEDDDESVEMDDLEPPKKVARHEGNVVE